MITSILSIHIPDSVVLHSVERQFARYRYHLMPISTSEASAARLSSRPRSPLCAGTIARYSNTEPIYIRHIGTVLAVVRCTCIPFPVSIRTPSCCRVLCPVGSPAVPVIRPSPNLCGRLNDSYCATHRRAQFAAKPALSFLRVWPLVIGHPLCLEAVS